METFPIFVAHSIGWIAGEWTLIRIILAVISAVLLIAIVRYVIVLDYFYERREYGRRAYNYSKEHKKQSVKKWEVVLRDIQTPNPALWKKAMQEADDLLFEVLRRAGYRGYNMEQVLVSIDEAHVPHIEELKKERMKIFALLSDESFAVEYEDAKKILRLYREILRGFGTVE